MMGLYFEGVAEKIHNKSIEVLETIGFKLDHKLSEEILLSNGATKKDGRILLSKEMVELALKKVVPSFKLFNRDGTKFIDVNNKNTYFGTGSDALYNIDPLTDKMDKSTSKDIERNVRITDCLEHFDFVMSTGLPCDVSQDILYPKVFELLIKNTSKPLVLTLTNLNDVKRIHEIAEIVCNGKFIEKPFLIIYVEPISPLKLDSGGAERLIYCAKNNIPMLFAAGANLGSGTPITPELGVIQGNAEFLFGYVLTKLINPHAKIISGANTTSMDMRSSIIAYGSPEWPKTVGLYAEMGRYYNMPIWGTAGCSDSLCVDFQAAWEAQESILMALITKATLNHDVGYLGHGEIYDPRMIILTNEMIKRAKHLLKKLDFDKDISVIKEVATKDEIYLTHPHTAQNFKEALWIPPKYFQRGSSISNTDYFNRELMKEYLKLLEYEPKRLPNETLTKIDEYMKKITKKSFKEEFIERLNENVLLLDGAMGTMLQKHGFVKGCPHELNIIDPEIVKKVHLEYAQAGSDILLTNTFGGNRIKLKEFGLEDKGKEINQSAVRIIRNSCPDKIVCGDIGPLGVLLEPMGNLSFNEAYTIFKEQVEWLKDADILIIETISDIMEFKAALLAAKESGKLVIASMTFEGSRTTTGTDVKTYTKIADSLGADIIGLNCSTGPDVMYENLKIILENTSKPVIAQPNAGVPRIVEGNTVFNLNSNDFAQWSKKFAELGVNIIGGCCGTNPEFIKKAKETVLGVCDVKKNDMQKSICSRTKTVDLGNVVIGSKIGENLAVVRNEAIQEKGKGAQGLLLNVRSNLVNVIDVVQSTVDLPIIIQSNSFEEIKNGLKKIEGRPLVYIPHLDNNELYKILREAKKFGAGVIFLCMDEGGIPNSVDKKINVAKKYAKIAERVGLQKSDIFFDCVTESIAVKKNCDQEILDCVDEIKKLGYGTCVSISQMSYGLPNRSEINQKFYSKVVKQRPDLIIMDPDDMVIRNDMEIKVDFGPVKNVSDTFESGLKDCILYGDIDNIERYIDKDDPTKMNDILIGAMEIVGKKFKDGEIFLPQVMRSANAMKTAFKYIKEKIKTVDCVIKEKIVIASVENDVHDIGKNIVATILESHGYEVIDLGKDVAMETIIDTAKKENAKLIALSALMTTTAPEMETIVNFIKENRLNIPVIIGGAVITQDYADSIDAFYSTDAISSVKVIKEILGK